MRRVCAKLWAGQNNNGSQKAVLLQMCLLERTTYWKHFLCRRSVKIHVRIEPFLPVCRDVSKPNGLTAPALLIETAPSSVLKIYFISFSRTLVKCWIWGWGIRSRCAVIQVVIKFNRQFIQFRRKMALRRATQSAA